MTQIAKVVATLIVWSAAAAMVMFTRSPSEAWVTPVIALIALIAAASSMQYIWRESDSGALDRLAAAQATEKMKRATRVERLLDKLDEADLDELRARLTGDDGEQMPIEDLLNRENERRSRP